MKKAALFLLVSLFIILKSGWDYSECNIRSANQDLAPTLWFEQTIDGSLQSPLLTRFYHNKLGQLGAELSRCYFDKISPGFFFTVAGIFGPLFLIYLFYKAASLGKWTYLAVLFLVPIIPLLSFNHPTSSQTVDLLAYLYKGFAIIGLNLFLFQR